MKITNGTLRLAGSALTVLAHCPLEAIPNSRVRTAKRLLDPWLISIEEVVAAHAQVFGFEDVPGSGRYEIPAENREALEAAVGPLLREAVELDVSLRPIHVTDIQKSGALLTPVQMDALESLGLIEGSIEEENTGAVQCGGEAQ